MSPSATIRRYAPGRALCCKAHRKARVVHADPELVARDPRLADLEDGGPDRPALADRRGSEIDPRGREVLTECAGFDRPIELGGPPGQVFRGVGIDGLVRATVDGSVGLGVAGEIHAADRDRTSDGRLPDGRPDGLATKADRPDTTDIDRGDGGRRADGRDAIGCGCGHPTAAESSIVAGATRWAWNLTIASAISSRRSSTAK